MTKDKNKVNLIGQTKKKSASNFTGQKEYNFFHRKINCLCYSHDD